MRIRTAPVLLTLVSLAACASQNGAQLRNSAREAAPPSRRETVEAIRLAVLLTYTHGPPSEGDVTLKANRITGTGEQGERAPLVLMTTPRGKQSSYRSRWVDSLIRAAVITGACRARDADDCPDSATSSFLRLNDLRVMDDSATVVVWDEATNPAACRRKAGLTMGGFMTTRFDLVRDGVTWQVVKRKGEGAGSTACGASPEQEARTARLVREDSALYDTTSPMAGTYRVTITFASGDSSVLYARTERHPMSVIRERRKLDFTDDHRPIVGYYLGTCSAGSIDSLAPTFYGKCLQSYYAVSVAPEADSTVGTVWHGEVDPLVEVKRLDPRPRIRELAHSLFGVVQPDDADWYYMPGHWVTTSKGDVRYEWTVLSGAEMVYTVRAERVSRKTLRRRPT